MGRYLIVANQTLGGEALDRAIHDRLREEHGSVFYVLIPTIGVEQEATVWTGGFVLDVPASTFPVNGRDGEEHARRDGTEFDESRQRAQHRLDHMLAKIELAGGLAEGEIGPPDPVKATKAVLERRADLDGIIVSTLPTTLSGWLKMDVPSRISRMTDLPVTTVEADE